MKITEEEPWSKEEFYNKLAGKRGSYHLEHSFQVKMNAGQLNRAQMQGWVLNRFYYQACIPLKDAAMLSNCPDQNVRKAWIQRIIDHDGQGSNSGGIEAWIRLGLACGLPRESIVSFQHVLPSVKFAVDAYVNFARTSPWQDTVCASLTELFAGEAHAKRLEAFPIHYPWIQSEGLEYFKTRLSQARRDVDHGLTITLDYFNTRKLQERALKILEFKLDILWSMLDAIELAYVEKGRKHEQ